MRRVRAALAVTTIAAGLAGASADRADTMPSSPPSPADAKAGAAEAVVPQNVKAAIVALKQACAAWQKPVSRPLPSYPPPRPPDRPPPVERSVCFRVADPEAGFMAVLSLGAAIGGILLLAAYFCFGVVFALVRYLLSRTPRSARSW